MSEIVQKEIKMKIYKNPYTDSQMHKHMLNEDIKIKKLLKDTFYFGEIYVDDNIYGVLGLYKEYWADKTSPDLDFLERIILKLINKKGKTTGLIEERLLKEFMQSTISGKLPVFTITLSGIPYMIDVEKESDKLVFPLLTNKSKRIFEIFQITKKTMAIGADFVVIRKLGEEKVADIDSKRGGKIDIKIYDSDVANNKQFIDILALFAATIKFHDSIGDKIEQAMEALKMGFLVLKPPKKALELMLNPRKIKLAERKEKEEEEEEIEKIRKKRRKRKIREKEEDLEPKEKKPLIKKPQKKEKDKLKSEKYKSLLLDDPVEKASGVTKTIAEKFKALGIITVEDLLSVNPDELATVIEDKSITSKTIKRIITASRKRVQHTLEETESYPDDADDYDLLDYGF